MNKPLKIRNLKKSDSSQNFSKRHTVLLVDDEAGNLEAVAGLLESEYNVITALSGPEALQILSNQEECPKISLIISDQRMPEMKGVEFLEKSIALVPNAVRILLTGYTDVNEIIDSVNQGRIFQFIAKPVETQSFLISIRRAVEVYDLENRNVQLIGELETKSRSLAESLLKLNDLNQSLEKKVSERTEELETLNSFSRKINSKTDLTEIFIHISKYIYSRYGIETLSLYLPEDAKNYLYTYKMYSYIKIPDVDYSRFSSIRILLSDRENIIAAVFHRKKPFYLRRMRRSLFSEEYFSETIPDSDSASFLLVPLVVREQTVGIFNFSKVSERLNLTKREITYLFSLCSQAAGIIHTANLLRQTEKARLDLERQKEALEESRKKEEEARKELETINDFTRVINETLNLEEVIESMFRYIEKKFGLEASFICMHNPSNNRLLLQNYARLPHFSEEQTGVIESFKVKLDDKKGINYRVFSTKKTFYAPSLSRTLEDYFYKPEKDLSDALKLEFLLIIPLLIKNSVIAQVIFTSFREKVKLTKIQIKKISFFCDQVAGAIYRNRLMKETEEAKKEAYIEGAIAQIAQEEAVKEKQKTDKINKELSVLNEFAKTINAKNDLDYVLQTVLDYMHESYGFQQVWLQTVDQSDRLLVPYRLFTKDSDLPKQSKASAKFFHSEKWKLNSQSGASYFSYRKKRYIYYKNLDKISLKPLDYKYRELSGINSIFVLPLIVQKEVIGLMHLNRNDGGRIDLKQNDIESIIRFSEQVAIAVNNSFLMKEVQKEKYKSQELLLNILPKETAFELLELKRVRPVSFQSAAVLFTDFQDFSLIAEKMEPDELLKELDSYFSAFDRITEKFNLEKLKTIGDSYMCVGGVPSVNATHTVDAVLAALQIQSYMKEKAASEKSAWHLRIGIHTGNLIAGVVGKKKFQYDVWGDTVNTASRMESGGAAGMINISGAAYSAVKMFFDTEYRGKISVKNKGDVDMYFVHGIRKELSKDTEGILPNSQFFELYSELQ